MGILQNILKAINTAIDNIDFSPYQLISNKSTDETLADNSDAKYPSQKAIKTYVDTGLGTKQNSLGYTAENQANKENMTLDTSSTKYPTNRLVKEYLDLKQNISEKNTRNGYLGLQNNVFVIHINFLQNNLVYGLPYLYNFTVSGGAGSYTSGGSANTPKIRSGNNTVFRLPTLNLTGSVTGNVTCSTNGVTAMEFKSPFKLLSEQWVTYTSLGTKNNTLVVGVGDGARGLSSFSGTLLFFILNPLQNGGNWRVGKVISGGTPAYVNTDVVPVYNNLTKFDIYYNKETETALFYIDDVLVYTMTSVNLPDTTNITNRMSLVRDDATETVSTYVAPIQETLIFDLR